MITPVVPRMIALEVPRMRPLALQGDHWFTLYNPFVKQWHIKTINRYVEREVYEWLIDNIGYPMFAYRKLDLVHYEYPNRILPKASLSVEELEQINPLLNDEPRKWFFNSNTFYFTSVEDATHFKLRWF